MRSADVRSLVRFLELAQRRLGAVDVRAEIGGRDPEDPRLVWVAVTDAWRVVAVMPEVPADRADLERQLEALVESFSATVSLETAPAPISVGAAHALDEALAALAHRARAAVALVVDDSSPVIFGASDPAVTRLDVDTALILADADAEARREEISLVAYLTGEAGARQRIERHVERLRRALPDQDADTWGPQVLVARALAPIRRASVERAEVARDDGGYLCRDFATIYRLVLVFEGPWSPLVAEGAVVHALQAVQHLVLSLPPAEPPPRRAPGSGAEVVKLRRLRSV